MCLGLEGGWSRRPDDADLRRSPGVMHTAAGGNLALRAGLQPPRSRVAWRLRREPQLSGGLLRLALLPRQR